MASSTLPLANICDSACSSRFVSCRTPGPVFSMRGHSKAIACCDQQSRAIPRGPITRFDIDTGGFLLSDERWLMASAPVLGFVSALVPTRLRTRGRLSGGRHLRLDVGDLPRPVGLLAGGGIHLLLAASRQPHSFAQPLAERAVRLTGLGSDR